jgi:hypothetical protein
MPNAVVEHILSYIILHTQTTHTEFRVQSLFELTNSKPTKLAL